jgi:hypothetical protein
MEFILILVLVVVSLTYISIPLLRGERKDADATTVRMEEAGARKEAALGALVDIENERLIGKLSTTDFELLREEYEVEALAALKELDAIEEGDADNDELEAEIAAMRARMACPECGGLRVPGEACSKCGNES